MKDRSKRGYYFRMGGKVQTRLQKGCARRPAERAFSNAHFPMGVITTQYGEALKVVQTCIQWMSIVDNISYTIRQQIERGARG
jgi:hypothetical protein